MDFLMDELERLEALSRGLDTPAPEFRSWMKRLEGFSLSFLESVERGPAYFPEERQSETRDGFSEQGADFPRVLAEFEKQVLPRGIHPGSGRFFGYIPGGGLPSAAVGDFLAALTNRYSGAYGVCPGAAEMENATVGWLREVVGMPASAWGTLQSGGSLATLTALLAAREGRPLESWRRGVIYATSEVHHCFDKSLKIAGLGEAPRREVAKDGRRRMSVADLGARIRRDREDGWEPWLICATAGTTNTGAVDPLAEIARLAKEEGLWFHVDGAYGGLFALVPEAAAQLRGMEQADSLVLDPHKGLFLPYGCGAVLVREGERLRRAMAYSPDYMQDLEGVSGRSPADYSPELTRHFRAVRLWLSLKLHGVERFRAALREKLLLARYLHHELSLVSGIEVGPAPQLTVVVFRAHGEDHRADEATLRLRDTLLARGGIHLSSTRLDGHVFLRMCVLCFRSHLKEVDTALAEIKGCL